MRALVRSVPRREHVLFLVIGLAGALMGHAILGTLIAVGWPPALANAAQLVLTLQWNFIANRELTWRRPSRPGTTGRIGFWASWWRFHTARGASAALCLAAYPGLAARIGSPSAYWLLLVVGAVVNYASDKHWSFGVDKRDATGSGPLSRLAHGVAAIVGVAVLTVVLLDPVIALISALMLAVAVTTLAFQLYKWWSPGQNDPHRYLAPALAFGKGRLWLRRSRIRVPWGVVDARRT